MVETQFKGNIKCLRIDYGRDFFNEHVNNLLCEKGIIHQSSFPYTPQRNGKAERKHIHLLEVARALKLQGSIPNIFLGDCILMACYLINHMPSKLLEEKCNLEMLYGENPVIGHLKIFGCLCYAKNMVETDKLTLSMG